MHLGCLKLWLKQKLSVRELEKMGVSYTIKSFNCELCKEPYPTEVKCNGQNYNLLDYFIPENQNYVILESLNSIKENQYPLSLHVMLFLDDVKFYLGRGHDADIRINDISVSRTHSKIYMKNGKFYIEDFNSKFGTLVLAKEAIELTENNSCIQIGRTLINMEVGLEKQYIGVSI
jgi:hypothetical protein